jgi:hypothetical protein
MKSNGAWELRYRRPDDHPDVKEWEAYLAKAPLGTRYRIRTVISDIEDNTRK